MHLAAWMRWGSSGAWLCPAVVFLFIISIRKVSSPCTDPECCLDTDGGVD